MCCLLAQVGSLKKEVSAQEIEAGRNFWDDHTEVQNLKTQESRTAMDRFASDASAFTTLSDSGSDSGYNSSETVVQILTSHQFHLICMTCMSQWFMMKIKWSATL